MASDTMASVDFRLLEDLRVLTKLVILYFHVRQATQTERNDTNMHVRQATQTDLCVKCRTDSEYFNGYITVQVYNIRGTRTR